NASARDLPADGVVTGRGRIDGRAVVVVANDPTVKAGSWGARTVEKLVRATELALDDELPIFWLVDSAGARITDQVELFPGRRGACLLRGPPGSVAGGSPGPIRGGAGACPDRRAGARRPPRRLRHAHRHRCAGRCRQLLRDQAAVRARACGWLRLPRWTAGGD